MPEQSMAERLQQMGPRLTVDDGFHVPTTLDYFWTETNWFALVIPDRKITIQLYPFFQTNLEVCSAAVYIWDDSGDQWWNCRRIRSHSAAILATPKAYHHVTPTSSRPRISW